MRTPAEYIYNRIFKQDLRELGAEVKSFKDARVLQGVSRLGQTTMASIGGMAIIESSPMFDIAADNSDSSVVQDIAEVAFKALSVAPTIAIVGVVGCTMYDLQKVYRNALSREEHLMKEGLYDRKEN